MPAAFVPEPWPALEDRILRILARGAPHRTGPDGWGVVTDRRHNESQFHPFHWQRALKLFEAGERLGPRAPRPGDPA